MRAASCSIPQRDVTGGFRLWRRETSSGNAAWSGSNPAVMFSWLKWLTWLGACSIQIGEVPIYFADRRLGKSKMSFKIQAEAAARVWQVLWAYRDLRRKGKAARVQ